MNEAEDKIVKPRYSMSMLGLSQFYRRLDPLVEAGVDFKIVNQGVMITTFIPESQLGNLLVRNDY